MQPCPIIFDPCYTVAARLNPTPGVEPEQMVALLKAFGADNVEEMIVTLADLLDKARQTPEAHSLFYVMALKACLAGVLQ